jgi:2-methylcitrate dehydratase PrpD
MALPDRAATLTETLALRALRFRDNPVSAHTAETVRLHALDSFGAILAGAHTSEGGTVRRALQRLLGASHASPAFVAATSAAYARMTEIDDIHLVSCTTPGSVVFAAAVAGQLAAGDIAVDAAGTCSAILAGYDAMVALGLAADGATTIYADIWPTYLGATISAAVTAGMLLDLPRDQLIHATAIAASLTNAQTGRVTEDPSARWITLGLAVQSGLGAALAAQHGIVGDIGLLDRRGETLGLVDAIDASPPLVSALEQTELKPYHTGRQSLSAVEAFRALIAEHQLDAADIDAIEVRVPVQLRAMIDRPAQPSTRQESRGVRYQLALAALMPERLLDVDRSSLGEDTSGLVQFGNRVRVVADDNLTALYPVAWSASVSVEVGSARFERQIISPKGSLGAPMGERDIVEKLRRVGRLLPQPLPVDELSAAAEALDLFSVLRLLR